MQGDKDKQGQIPRDENRPCGRAVEIERQKKRGRTLQIDKNRDRGREIKTKSNKSQETNTEKPR